MAESVLNTLVASTDALRRWGLRGSASVVDQGVLSGTNFLINILLARWLSPTSYGAFAVAFAVFLFLSGFHNAIILEPMSVFGPAKYTDRLSPYFRAQLKFHLVSAVTMGLLLAGAGGGLNYLRPEVSALGGALVGVGIALPCILFMWLARRLAYIRGSPEASLKWSVAYLLLAMIGLVLVRSYGEVTPVSAYLVVAGASLVAGTFLSIRLLRKDAAEGPSSLIDWRQCLREQWDYGRWIVVSTTLTTATGQLQPVVLAFVGLAAAGTLRAMQNFMMPMAQAVTSIGLLALPILSLDYSRGEVVSMRRKGTWITVALSATATSYVLLLLLFRSPLELFVYGGKYSAYNWMIPMLGLVPLFTGFSAGFSLMLRAARRPEIYLISSLASGMTGLVTALTLAWLWGIWGAALSIVLAYLVDAVTTAYLFKRWIGTRYGRAGL